MINYQLPEDVSPKMDYLRELMNHSQLMGSLMHICDVIFGNPKWAEFPYKGCEFARAIQDQDEELAYLQFLACIDALYFEEFNRLNVTRLGEYMPPEFLIEDGYLKQISR